MRSKLFVPGSRPELFGKALASEADAISIDLEDAVVESRKAQARTEVAAFLQSAEARSSRKAIIVRINAVDTPHFEADVHAIARVGVALLNLPKVESPEHIHAAIAILNRVETDIRIHEPIGLLVNIETPKGLRYASDIAAAHPRVAGLQLGYVDLFDSLGIERRDAANVHALMFAVRIAAGQAGKFAYDGAFADVPDVQGFRAEAQMARRLGYWGKSCIHPTQIELANEVFHPGAEDIAYARRVVQASREAASRGVGAFVLDGRMIDAPSIRRAEAIVAASLTSD
ncbi:MAG: HpcH/HpaI aldolase/citrate lyase family protein [Steroidobacter sp.]